MKKNIVGILSGFIVVLLIIIVFGIFTCEHKKESVNDYKKLCYYLLSSEFMKDNSISTADKNALKTYNERIHGKDLDLYFIRDSYIPLIKEFTTETKMSYTKFKSFEDIILEAIKQKQKN